MYEANSKCSKEIITGSCHTFLLDNDNDATPDNGSLIIKKVPNIVLNRHYMYSPPTDRNVHYAHPMTTPKMPNSDTKSTI